jgi:predicted kinase
VIFDGVSAKPAEREKISAIAAKLGVPFTGLWLDAPLEIQITRVEARKGDASDSNEAVVRAQAERDLGPITWTRIDAGQSPEHTFQQALAVLGLPQP